MGLGVPSTNRVLELPSIGWQLFALVGSQSDSTASFSSLDTYATRLLTEPLSRPPEPRDIRVRPRHRRPRSIPGASGSRRPFAPRRRIHPYYTAARPPSEPPPPRSCSRTPPPRRPAPVRRPPRCA